jgi:tetratricopeptide (TPR) repeat protein
MHDSFESLLKRCKAYRRKKMLKKLSFFTGILILLVAVFCLYEFSDILSTNEPVQIEPNVKILKQKPIITKEVVIQKVVPVAVIKKEVHIEEEPSKKPTRKDVSYDLNVDENYLFERVKKEPKSRVKKELKAPAKKVVIPVEKETIQIPKQKSSKNNFSISTKKLTGVEDLYTQYKKNPHYDLALKISQAYYDEKKFSKASLWAKKANMLDKESDSAWIIYAKSEYARGNQDQAKEILQLYLGNKNSKDAEMLLMTWNQGE